MEGTHQPDDTAFPDDPDADALALLRRARDRLSSDPEQDRREALDLIVARHAGPVFAVCLRMVGRPPGASDIAADLTQDVLAKVVERVDAFDARSRLGTWIVRIAMNRCLTWLRARRLRSHASLDATAAADSREPAARSGVQHHGGREGDDETVAQRRVRTALDRVSDEHRVMLVLRDVRGLEYEEIAAALNLPGGTVRSRLFRARAALRNAFEATDASEA